MVDLTITMCSLASCLISLSLFFFQITFRNSPYLVCRSLQCTTVTTRSLLPLYHHHYTHLIPVPLAFSLHGRPPRRIPARKRYR